MRDERLGTVRCVCKQGARGYSTYGADGGEGCDCSLLSFLAASFLKLASTLFELSWKQHSSQASPASRYTRCSSLGSLRSSGTWWWACCSKYEVRKG